MQTFPSLARYRLLTAKQRGSFSILLGSAYGVRDATADVT
jgi:hypothetical protein